MRKRWHTAKYKGVLRTVEKDKALITQGFFDNCGCLRHIELDSMVEVSGIEKRAANLLLPGLSLLLHPIGYALGHNARS